MGQRKKGRRKYGKKASQKVARAMREKKRGTLRSGRSGKKVRSRKQAIAIALSEARREGAKVPDKKAGRKKKSSRKKAGRKKASREKTTRRKSGRKKTVRRTRARKTTRRR